ncbi:hypothetical protein A2U01_0077242, partial [Trifolium medium]|nr:hypothetical protein [Trifolium medium]
MAFCATVIHRLSGIFARTVSSIHTHVRARMNAFGRCCWGSVCSREHMPFLGLTWGVSSDFPKTILGSLRFEDSML